MQFMAGMGGRVVPERCESCGATDVFLSECRRVRSGGLPGLRNRGALWGVFFGMSTEDDIRDPLQLRMPDKRDTEAIPRLSQGHAFNIIDSSPLHTWMQHPMLNPNYQDEKKLVFDLGTVSHEWILQGLSLRGNPRAVIVKGFSDYRKADARKARDEAWAEGLMPLLEHQAVTVEAMVVAYRRQFPDLLGNPEKGKAEQYIRWEDEKGIVCSARLDWVPNSGRINYELKTDGQTAEPEAWARNKLWDGRNLMQAAFYVEAWHAHTREDRDVQFVVVENKPPYGASLVGLSGHGMAVAEAMLWRAKEVWKRCMDTGKWPSYGSEPTYVFPPQWLTRKWDVEG